MFGALDSGESSRGGNLHGDDVEPALPIAAMMPSLALASAPDPAVELMAAIRSARSALDRLERRAESLLPPTLPPAGAAATVDLGRMARAIYRARGLREKWFADLRLAEPAWDILLDLYASQCEERTVSVSSCCIAARIPPTTALRWVDVMEAKGHLQRLSDPFDGRRQIVRLTPETFERMSDLLLRLASHRVI